MSNDTCTKFKEAHSSRKERKILITIVLQLYQVKQFHLVQAMSMRLKPAQISMKIIFMKSAEEPAEQFPLETDTSISLHQKQL